MKTIKIFLSVAGFAITSTCFGQLFSENNDDVLFYTSTYNVESNRIEHQINHFPTTDIAGDHFNSPVLNRTYFVPIEYDLAVEPWMTSSFESSYYEEDIQLEDWMESPFDNGYYEAALEVEDWMETPFDCSYYEAVLEVEDWMTEPFDSEDEIEIETWMTTPWI